MVLTNEEIDGQSEIEIRKSPDDETIIKRKTIELNWFALYGRFIASILIS